MSAVGLTKAMRAALETRQFSDVMFKRAQEMGFIDEFSNYYPRAAAALAAPRMTQAELEYLEFVEGGPLARIVQCLWVAGALAVHRETMDTPFYQRQRSPHPLRPQSPERRACCDGQRALQGQHAMKWLRRLFRCRKGVHRPEIHVDHATLTIVRCKDCGKRFKLTDLSIG